MGMAHTPEKTGIPLITGSTKTIMEALYKNQHDIRDVPSNNKALDQAIILDIHTAQSGRNIMTAPNRLTETSEANQVSIDKARSNFIANVK
jgi:hypothetical protein